MKCEQPCCGAPENDVQPFALTVFTFGVIHLALCRAHRWQLMLTCGMSKEAVSV